MPHTDTPPRGAGTRPGGCLLGVLDLDGHRYRAVPVAEPTDPADMVAELRRFWRQVAYGEPGVFTNLLLGHGWRLLDVDRRRRDLPGAVRNRVGVPDATASAAVGDLHHSWDRPGPGWLYLYDTDWDQIRCYEATVHGQWLLHSRHDLEPPPAQPLTVAGRYGDAATVAGHIHRWRPGTVGLDRLPTTWPAEICNLEHARGITVARLGPDMLAHLVDITTAAFHDRRPGAALPQLGLDSQGALRVVWYRGSGHEQQMVIPCDDNGRVVIGPQVLPWTQPADTPPVFGHRPNTLRNGTPPIHEWVTEAGFHACHPILADYPLPLISAAVTALSPHTPAVLTSAHHYGPVWLVTPSHALMLTADGDPAEGTVTLPRPLGGSWNSDPPARVLAPDTVADRCAQLRDRFTTLTNTTT